MQITLDTDRLTALDREVLRVLSSIVEPTATKPTPEPAAAPALPKTAKGESVGVRLQREAAERAAAEKAAKPEVVPVEEPEPQPKKTTPRKPRPAKTEPVEEPTEPRPVEDEAPATPSPAAAAVTDEDDKAVVGEAIARATQLQADGKGARIKEVLASLGAKRVSLMTATQARQFLTELED